MASLRRPGWILAGIGALALLIGIGVALRRTNQAQPPSTIRIDGSSTVFPVFEYMQGIRDRIRPLARIPRLIGDGFHGTVPDRRRQ